MLMWYVCLCLCVCVCLCLFASFVRLLVRLFVCLFVCLFVGPQPEFFNSLHGYSLRELPKEYHYTINIPRPGSIGVKLNTHSSGRGAVRMGAIVRCDAVGVVRCPC